MWVKESFVSKSLRGGFVVRLQQPPSRGRRCTREALRGKSFVRQVISVYVQMLQETLRRGLAR